MARTEIIRKDIMLALWWFAASARHHVWGHASLLSDISASLFASFIVLNCRLRADYICAAIKMIHFLGIKRPAQDYESNETYLSLPTFKLQVLMLEKSFTIKILRMLRSVIHDSSVYRPPPYSESNLWTGQHLVHWTQNCTHPSDETVYRVHENIVMWCRATSRRAE